MEKKKLFDNAGSLQQSSSCNIYIKTRELMIEEAQMIQYDSATQTVMCQWKRCQIILTERKTSIIQSKTRRKLHRISIEEQATQTRKKSHPSQHMERTSSSLQEGQTDSSTTTRTSSSSSSSTDINQVQSVVTQS